MLDGVEVAIGSGSGSGSGVTSSPTMTVRSTEATLPASSVAV